MFCTDCADTPKRKTELPARGYAHGVATRQRVGSPLQFTMKYIHNLISDIHHRVWLLARRQNTHPTWTKAGRKNFQVYNLEGGVTYLIR